MSGLRAAIVGLGFVGAQHLQAVRRPGDADVVADAHRMRTGRHLHPTDTRQTLRWRTIGMVLSGQLTLGGLPRLTVPVDELADGVAGLDRPAEVLQVVISFGQAA